MFIDRNADRSADRTSRNYRNAMKLSVNRQAVEADAGETLAGLLQRMSVPAEGVAVAVNNRVVPRSEWATTPLHEEDRITIIRAVCGG